MAQRWWILTIPRDDWTIPASLPEPVRYIRGQLERGDDTGYEHWQLVANFRNTARLAMVKRIFGDTAHAEPTRSDAALAYVWKDDTRIPDSKFELGELPFQRNKSTDWQRVLDAAKRGDLDSPDIPPDVLVRHIGNLQTIRAEYSEPIAVDRAVSVLWGPTGTGKTFRAWQAAGVDAYLKDPSNKWWDGYRSQRCVIIDEFAGDIPITSLLRWTDRYPLRGEVKRTTVALNYEHIWITSNLHPNDWYPEANVLHKDALMRRMTNESLGSSITYCGEPFIFPESPDISQ